MDPKLAKEIKLRLKAPMIVVERIVEGQQVPKVFGQAALRELKIIQEIAEKAGKSKCK